VYIFISLCHRNGQIYVISVVVVFCVAAALNFISADTENYKSIWRQPKATVSECHSFVQLFFSKDAQFDLAASVHIISHSLDLLAQIAERVLICCWKNKQTNLSTCSQILCAVQSHFANEGLWVFIALALSFILYSKMFSTLLCSVQAGKFLLIESSKYLGELFLAVFWFRKSSNVN